MFEMSAENSCTDLPNEHFELQRLLEVLAVDSENGAENKGVESLKFGDFPEIPMQKFHD